jgi:hypothetical protein
MFGTSLILATIFINSSDHRRTQDRPCYVRRNDACEPMSMAEIQDQTKQIGRSMENADRALLESAERFLKAFRFTHLCGKFHNIGSAFSLGGVSSKGGEISFSDRRCMAKTHGLVTCAAMRVPPDERSRRMSIWQRALHVREFAAYVARIGK